MRVLAVTILIAGLIAGAFAREVLEYLEVDGKRYDSVKWGTVNQGKVVIFHSRGVATIPLEKLPAEYQAKFGYRPPAEAPPAAPTNATTPVTDPREILEAMRAKRADTGDSSPAKGEWARYNRDRAGKVLLDGKLVEKSSLTTVTGFLVREVVHLSDGEREVRGAVLDTARRRADTGEVASSMELRPSLWERTGEQIVLLDYTPATVIGGMLRIYGVDLKPVQERRVLKVGVEPSFEQWQALGRR